MKVTKKELRTDIREMRLMLSHLEDVLDGHPGMEDRTPEQTASALTQWLYRTSLGLLAQWPEIARVGEESAARRAKKEQA